MPIISLQNVSLAFGDKPLLDGISLSIDHAERVCLIGRNGEGKSTLLKVIAGDLQADEGELVGLRSARIACLEQEVPLGLTGSVFDVVADGLGAAGRLVQQYHALSHQVATDHTLLDELERCQHELEAAGGWEINQRVETTLARLALDGEARIEQLSGGLKRRVLLARALVSDPDLLLLDEPTNHLDIAAIEWLESFLLGASTSLLFITHDRAFLRRLATRIIELDRGQLTDWPGNYDQYLTGKQQLLDAEEKQNALFDKRLAEEERWVRQGIKARRTRNEGRVRALQALRRERAQRREQQGTARLSMQGHQSSGKIVVETEAATFAYPGAGSDGLIIRPLTTTILRGDKIGIIGPNGAGKTTLIKLLLGELQPSSGSARLGTNLQIAYFDQYRSLIDDAKTVQENVGDGSDTVTINGQSRHVIGYLNDFLFPPRRARQPASVLSGGERNRLMLAKLFARPANLLVLDEPTNDLDMDTLDLLQELLVDYSGTVLLVSHDRDFINQVVTSTLVFEGDGQVNEYVGGYDDWLAQRAPLSTAATAGRSQAQSAEQVVPTRAGQSALPTARRTAGAESAHKAARKLSYKLQRELELLPQQIEQLEQQQAELTAAMSEPSFYQRDSAQIQQATQTMQRLSGELEQCYARWDELESLR
ncbi:MAG: ATP-binding cassette domain-containing protein [Wenzhouxiangellaceae bacterium]